MGEVNNINVHKINSVCLTTDDFRNYILDNYYNENIFIADGKINPNYNDFKKQD